MSTTTHTSVDRGRQPTPVSLMLLGRGTDPFTERGVDIVGNAVRGMRNRLSAEAVGAA